MIKILKPTVFNWWLLLITIALGVLGIVNLSSATQGASGNLALVQGGWLGFGVLLCLGLSWMDYRTLDKMAYPFLVICLLALLAVLVGGRVVSGSQRWINIGPLNVQPSEIAKIAVVLALAKYFHEEPSWPKKGYSLLELIKPTSILYPIGSMGALILFWEKLQSIWELLETEDFNILLMVLCLVWGAISFLHFIRQGKTGLHDVLSPIILVLLPAVLILRQPDLGTTLVLFAIAGTMVLFVKIRWESLYFVGLNMIGLILMVLVVVSEKAGEALVDQLLRPPFLTVGCLLLGVFGIYLFFRNKLFLSLFLLLTNLAFLMGMLLFLVSTDSVDVLEHHQKKRILTFFYPETASKDDRWQSYQSEIAVGAGQVKGKGLGKSTQSKFKFLPERHTDFVFSVWAEEWGFVGCLMVLLLFLFWLMLMVNVASVARDKFGVLITVGVVAMNFWHIAINVGMVIGLAPIVGLTLPLWSYGGSSVLTTMLGIGLLMSITARKHGL